MENQDKTPLQKQSVHKILAHSYSVYFIFFLIVFAWISVFNFKFFNNFIAIPLGFIFLIFGTFLVFWAQKTSRHLDVKNVSKETFCHGPYRYTRSPTHLGLFLLMLGFGMIANAFFIVLFSIISFLITKFVFLKKEEKILAAKYGTPYLEYKKSVKF